MKLQHARIEQEIRAVEAAKKAAGTYAQESPMSGLCMALQRYICAVRMGLFSLHITCLLQEGACLHMRAELSESLYGIW